MGVDTYCLLVEWEPTVAAYRRAGGMDFYWEEHDDPAPFVATRTLAPGSVVLTARDYYRWLRAALPPDLVGHTATFLDMVWPGVDDLRTDAGPSPSRSGLWYSMRPDTVRLAVRRADRVPWDDVEVAAELMDLDRPSPPGGRGRMDADLFVNVVVGRQREWLAEAADRNHGVVTIVSQ